MIIAVDDVCPSNLDYWKHCEEMKEANPNVTFIAFVIANYNYTEDVSKNKEFIDWFEANKNWVEVGVHGYDHGHPPEQERDEAEELVEKSLNILRPFLGDRFLYRPPGFQRTIKTEKMLKKLGFSGIAYQTRIKYFDGQFIEDVFNMHCCDKFVNPVTKWENLFR